jgi:hypothetical protein
VSTAQWHQVDLQAQLPMTRYDWTRKEQIPAVSALSNQFFAAPHTPNFRLLSLMQSEANAGFAKALGAFSPKA